MRLLALTFPLFPRAPCHLSFTNCPQAALTGVMWRLVDALGVADALGIKPSALSGFIQDLAVGYRDNPFHNLHHATCVTHFTYMLVQGWDARRLLSPQQVYHMPPLLY